MKKALKFLIPVLGNAALIFADGDNGCCPKPKCETKCKEVCNPCPTKKICKTTCIEVRPRPPCECVTRACDCGVDFFITGDFTWWKPRQDGMEYAVTEPLPGGVSGVTAASTTPSQGKVYHAKAQYEPGFKVGVGLDFCDWGWDVYLNYTWFRTENNRHASSSAATGAGLQLQDSYWFAGINNNIGPLSYASATSHWKVHMNVLDLEFGRKFWIGKHIMIRPQAGLKGVWNRQHLDNYYFSSTATTFAGTPVLPALAETQMHQRIKNDGVGIRAGMCTAWHFSRGFSLFGDFALTGLWQKFKVSRNDEVSLTTAGVVTAEPVNVRDHFYSVTPVLEWMFGLKWETWSCGDNYHFGIKAAWEEQIWLDQNRYIRMPGTARQGDSSFNVQGLTLGAFFEF